MTTDQMYKALTEIGACFAVSTAKYVSPNDPFGSKPSYHIHPDYTYPHEKDIERVYSQTQFKDWIRTVKAAKRATSEKEAASLWIAYQDRWTK